MTIIYFCLYYPSYSAGNFLESGKRTFFWFWVLGPYLFFDLDSGVFFPPFIFLYLYAMELYRIIPPEELDKLAPDRFFTFFVLSLFAVAVSRPPTTGLLSPLVVRRLPWTE